MGYSELSEHTPPINNPGTRPHIRVKIKEDIINNTVPFTTFFILNFF
jgi:hypothetical protein